MVTADVQKSRGIDGKGRTVRELLAGRKYSIDYYQREYKWQRKQLTELLDDLAEMFLENYEEGHERQAVADYSRYFLGSIIISDKDGERFIIDGQQRLTTLTLLLIYVKHQLTDLSQQGVVAELIHSTAYGNKSFNLDVPDRTPCMEALFNGDTYVSPDGNESIANILARYADIDECFPEELQGEVLPYFADWLIENVQLVEITAYTDRDAYTIFETMNDRGLSLTPVDMLKGYLLANITDAKYRTQMNKVWRARTTALLDLAKDEDSDGIKNWLRSQYAESIRERKKGAAPQDFDLIGTEFHRWVRDSRERIGLNKSGDFQQFIERDFAFYAKWYERIRKAAIKFDKTLPAVYYNARSNFTLQSQLLLASLDVSDSDEEINRKLATTSTFLDIMINRRLWNWSAISYSSMQYSMFNLTKDIRRLELDELAAFLAEKICETDEFAKNDRLRLHGTNGPAIHRMLARITDFVEVGSGSTSRFLEYEMRGGKNPYEIEHIWANHYDRHSDEFTSPTEFSDYRNRIGDLLLLPKKSNASFGDLTYEKKLPHYDSQNLLARSLHEKAYVHNPGFTKFITDYDLPFEPVAEFTKAELDKRQKLYTKLAELVWNPSRIAEAAGTA